MTNYLRPDEQATLSEIERSQSRDRNLNRIAKTTANVGLAAGTAGVGLAASKIGSKILPLLNEFIPTDFAIKGISKISPELGNFLKKGMEKGLDVKEGLNFIKDNIMSSEQAKTEEPKKNKNIIEQESPELHQFLDQLIRGGRKPIEAAALAQNDKRFASVIQKLSKTHKVPWSQIIQNIYGTGETAQPNQQQQTNQGQQQQQRGISPKVQEALQKIMQM